ncbi:MAG: DUF3368 domain-containing protein [Candidatus Omnitrophota bacterium]
MAKMKVIVDATVFVNFALIGREAILEKLFGDFCFTTEEVIKELHRGEEREILPKSNRSWVKVLKVTTEEEYQSFILFNRRLGEGESSCLSLAISHNLNLLTDDLDTRKYAQRRGVSVSGTIGVLVVAVRGGIVSLEEGNRLLLGMIEKGYYSPCKKLNELM